MPEPQLGQTLSIILGGGRGERLFPLTKARSKPAVPLGGKHRIVDVPVSNCINSGLSKIFVLTQYNSASLNRHLINAFRFDHFSDGFVEALAAELTLGSVEWFKGTADAVRRCLRHFERYEPRSYLILSGDQLYRMDFRQMLAQHHETKADITVSVVPVLQRHVGEFGLLRINKRKRVVGFTEKPEDAEPVKAFEHDAGFLKACGFEGIRRRRWLASMGIYVFKAGILERVLKDESRIDFGHDVLPEVYKHCRVFAYPFSGYWRDIGTIRAFYDANVALTADRPPFDFYSPTAPIYTHPRFLPASKLRRCSISNAVVSEGVIADGASFWRSVIGIRSIVREGSVLSRTVMMGADYYDERRPRNRPALGIGRHCRIEKAIIDKNARIGDNVRITNERSVRQLDGDGYYIRDGIVVIEKNATIPAGTVI
jgi:glucose-1-phosphate adenylyltransferase